MISPGNVTVFLNPPIQISATASTGAYTAGQFMFLQIVNSTYSQYNTNPNGNIFYLKNNTSGPPATQDFDGPLLDNGASANVGYPFIYNGSRNNFNLGSSYGNPIPAAGLSNPYMQDAPSYNSPLTNQFVWEADTFSTYLMYQPSLFPADWIALGAVDWSWSEQATNNAGPVNPAWDGNSSQQPNPSVITDLAGGGLPHMGESGLQLPQPAAKPVSLRGLI